MKLDHHDPKPPEHRRGRVDEHGVFRSLDVHLQEQVARQAVRTMPRHPVLEPHAIAAAPAAEEHLLEGVEDRPGRRPVHGAVGQGGGDAASPKEVRLEVGVGRDAGREAHRDLAEVVGDQVAAVMGGTHANQLVAAGHGMQPLDQGGHHCRRRGGGDHRVGRHGGHDEAALIRFMVAASGSRPL